MGLTVADKLEIEVLISPEGKVSLKTKGFKGPTCFEETASLERVLGKVTQREKSSEYYQQATSSTKVKVR